MDLASRSQSEKDVLRFEIAVDDTQGVASGDRRDHRQQDVECLGDVQVAARR